MSLSDFDLRAVFASLAAGIVWAAICLALRWPLNGVLGIALGAMVGAAMLAVQREGGEAASLSAAGIAVLVLLTAAIVQSRLARSDARAEANSDKSYLITIAEQILWEQISDAKSEKQAAMATDGWKVPDFASLDDVPADLRAEADRRWAEMTVTEKEKLQGDRTRFEQTAYGAKLEQFDTEATTSGWIAVVLLAGIAALVVPLWPRLAARFPTK